MKMNIFPKGFPTTIIMLLTVWRCVVVHSISTKTVKEMIEMTFRITEDYVPQTDDEEIMVKMLKQCHEYFLKERFLVNFKEIMANFVGVIMRIGFTNVHKFLESEFETKPNDFWNSIKKDIDEISSCFESDVKSEIWEPVNDDKNGKQKTKELSSSSSSLSSSSSSSSRYEKQRQQEFVALEKHDIMKEKPLRAELMLQAERVGAALLYTLIHMKMRLLFDREQVKKGINISKTSAKIKSKMRKQFKSLQKAVVERINSLKSNPSINGDYSDNDDDNNANNNNDDDEDDDDKEKSSTNRKNQKNNDNEKGGIDPNVHLHKWVTDVEKAFRTLFNQEKDQFLEALDKKIPGRDFSNAKNCVDEWENIVYLM
ncbi:hypothetical protein niasHT_013211 [Heterodera trifolii]|uniref:Uncharacterized protein n=1 Tax=Heterodera trifolii TaxID=157864 RepID=A0ABD2KY27_9BILA